MVTVGTTRRKCCLIRSSDLGYFLQMGECVEDLLVFIYSFNIKIIMVGSISCGNREILIGAKHFCRIKGAIVGLFITILVGYMLKAWSTMISTSTDRSSGEDR